MFELLGLRDEEEKARKAAAASAKCADKENVPAQNIDGASLHVDDCIPGEKVNHVMYLRCELSIYHVFAMFYVSEM